MRQAHGPRAALVVLSVTSAVCLGLASLLTGRTAASASPHTDLRVVGAFEQELEAPPAPGAHGWLWFAERGPTPGEGVLGATEGEAADSATDDTANSAAALATAIGPGFWHRAAETASWEWTALAPELLTHMTYDGIGPPPPPAWPSEVTRLQAQQVARSDGDTLGYWVWNPSVFAGGSGTHFWSPRWQWAPSGEPLLLAPSRLTTGTDGTSA